jgi:hypothetical protein
LLFLALCPCLCLFLFFTCCPPSKKAQTIPINTPLQKEYKGENSQDLERKKINLRHTNMSCVDSRRVLKHRQNLILQALFRKY